MKQRHVIVEQVAILNEPARPSPDNMEMLRFIAVESVVQNIYHSDDEHHCEKNCCGDELGWPAHFEIICATPRKRYVLRSCAGLVGRHVEMKAGGF